MALCTAGITHFIMVNNAEERRQVKQLSPVPVEEAGITVSACSDLILEDGHCLECHHKPLFSKATQSFPPEEDNCSPR